VRLPALGLLRFRRDNLMLMRSGPTRDVVRTTHVGPNQTAGPTAWPNRIYANFVAKNRAWTLRRDLARLGQLIAADVH
jgi:hypothetical protein